MKKPKIPIAPLTKEEFDALMDVVEGELRGLFLMVLLTQRPVKDIVCMKRGEVVPWVRELADHFTTTNYSANPDALLFPRLAALPPHLLFRKAKSHPRVDVNLQLRDLVADISTRVEATARERHPDASQKRKTRTRNR